MTPDERPPPPPPVSGLDELEGSGVDELGGGDDGGGSGLRAGSAGGGLDMMIEGRTVQGDQWPRGLTGHQETERAGEPGREGDML